MRALRFGLRCALVAAPILTGCSSGTMIVIRGVKRMESRPVGADPTRLAQIGLHLLLETVFEDGFVRAGAKL